MNSRLPPVLKKILVQLKYFSIYSVVFLILEIGVGYWLISTRWKLFLTPKQMEAFAADINQSEPVPANFKNIYTKIFPQHVHATMADQLFFNYLYRYVVRKTKDETTPHCFCSLVSDFQERHNGELKKVTWDSRMKELEYGFGLERFTSPEKCFDYVMTKRIQETKASLDTITFKNLVLKNVNSYTDDELVEFILLTTLIEYDQHEYKEFRESDFFNEKFTLYKDKIASK